MPDEISSLMDQRLQTGLKHQGSGLVFDDEKQTMEWGGRTPCF